MCPQSHEHCFSHIMSILCWVYSELCVLAVAGSSALEQMAGEAVPELGILEDAYLPALSSELEDLP